MKTNYRFDNTKDRYGNEKHIHKLGGKPLKGTTTVIKEVMPPPLAWYGSGKACKKLGWYDRKESRSNYMPDEEGMPILKEKLNEIKKMKPKEYLDLLDEAYKAHNEYKKKKGKYGNKVHEAIEDIVKKAISEEGYVLGNVQTNDDDLQKAIDQFVEWADGKKFLGSETHVFSEKIWTGGIVDLVYKEGDSVYLGDIKTSKRIYPSQIIQMGLYDYQQAENGFVDQNGKVIGKPKEIEGYTVINLPKGKDKKVVNYDDTEEMREFAENIGQLHETLQNLKSFLKNA